MSKRTQVLIFLLTFALIVTLGEQCLAADSPPRAHAEAFMNQILKGDIDNATKGLFRETNILSQNEMAPMQLSTDLMTLQADYGTPIGFQLISEHTLRQALVRFQYLLKFKTQPVVWEFYYYQPESTWLLYMINFDRELGELFPK